MMGLRQRTARIDEMLAERGIAFPRIEEKPQRTAGKPVPVLVVMAYVQLSPSTIAARAHAAADASFDWAAYFARWDELSAMLEGAGDSPPPLPVLEGNPDSGYPLPRVLEND